MDGKPVLHHSQWSVEIDDENFVPVAACQLRAENV